MVDPTGATYIADHMTEQIGDILAQHYAQTFSWIDRVHGVVERLPVKQAEGPDSFYPASLAFYPEPDVDEACKPGVLTYVVPDAKYTALMHFEDLGAKPTKKVTGGEILTGRLMAVNWWNYSKIGVQPVGRLQAAMISAIPDEITVPGVGVAKISLNNVPPKRPSPWSAYSFPESTKQYLRSPYGHCAIVINYTIAIRYGCTPEIVINPSPC